MAWEVMDLPTSQTVSRTSSPQSHIFKEGRDPGQGGESHKLSHLPNLDELLEEIRRKNAEKESSFSD